MRIPVNVNISYKDAGLVVLVIFLLTIFCRIVHLSLIIPLLLLFAGIHLFLFNKANLRLFLNLGLLLTIVIAGSYLTQTYTDVSPLFIPVAAISMLTMLLYNDLQLSFLMAILSSTFVSLIVGHRLEGVLGLTPLELTITYFIGNMTASYIVSDARTRGKVISAGFYVGIMQVVTVVLMHPEISFMLNRAFATQYIYPLLMNGFLVAGFVMMTSKIFELLFGVITNFTLLELSDFNHPLLKRMILEAPGTYHHSLVVSNLSEAAADSIGANSLLTRVGAYYHDIGKIDKSEYFTENQIVGGNKHDRMEPSMSRLVILNHVKEGIELARKNKLNQKIIDFIPQHHGTSLMYYFYQKALEEADDESGIKEENYRYPGPKPQSRETAIVLLADSVEGATRALEEPNPQRIEELVRKVINNKFIDGQLDDCNLTLKEIELIALTFTRVLSAMYHGRIKYPEKKNGIDDRNRKSAEEGTAKSPKDQNRNQENPPA